jgi:CRISPR-associated endonuclease/helicase Cas3
MTLDGSRFDDFFRAVHGPSRSPFPWQRRLLDTVLAQGWPQTISLPTASGKTSVLDVAVFSLACQAGRPVSERSAPRRMALVVDRRIVVDDAHAHALRIQAALEKPAHETAREVREALSMLGGETPLDVVALRGGIYREDRWARTPLQPVILCSTVDQVGSRLLHRGYGLSSGVWPIHAGLLAHDTLIVLDEAHCSEPFLQTLSYVARYRQVARKKVPGPFTFVAMTATPRGDAAPFRLDQEDRAHPALSQRLSARKKARLVVAGGSKDDDLVKACVEQVREHAKTGTTTLVVLNRVSAARELRNRLAKLDKDRKDPLHVDSVLLTGRCRAVERDRLLERWRSRLMAGRDRQAVQAAPPLVVVATQCVEVGADLDVDALVTEACPLDSLRQRVGRLDRLGTRGESLVSVVCRQDQVGKPAEPADDPIYGTSLSRTWQWLVGTATPEPWPATSAGPAGEGGTDTGSPPDTAGEAPPSGPPGQGPLAIELGTDALDALLPAGGEERATLLRDLSAPAPDAPVVFPAYCDLWVQTGPEPGVTPDPSVFLHGPARGQPEVRLAWRADLGEDPDTWADTVSMCPPVTGETLPLPLGVARAFLSGTLAKTVDPGDLESAPASEEDDETVVSRAFLRWRGPERSEVSQDPQALRPGDVVVLPCERGGCDPEGWNPAAQKADDVADLARGLARRAAVLRLHPGLAGTLEKAPPSLRELAQVPEDAWPEDLEERVAAALETAASVAGLDKELLDIVGVLAKDRRRGVEPHPSGTGLVISSRQRLGEHARDFTDEDATSGHAADPATLETHLEQVGRLAQSMARQAGLPDDWVEDVALAARLHDLGKADPRFQAWLAGGDRVKALRAGLLAKSARMPRSSRDIQLAREKAGYPQGGRHELLSLRLAECGALQAAHDVDLVKHLVASHHGHCRPWAPVVEDPRPLEVAVEVAGVKATACSATGLERLDSGVAERFWALVRCYGWWGLSFLEACVRLADHRVSEGGGEVGRT